MYQSRRKRGFDRLPWHTLREHRQQIAQIDYLVNTRVEEVFGDELGEIGNFWN